MRTKAIVTLVCVLQASVAVGPAHAAASRLLRRMVVVGDSVLAGFASGGLVKVGQPGQLQSAPAMIARRAHVKLSFPLMDRPGVPAPLQIVDANGNGQLDRGEVRRVTDDIGFRDDPGQRARNLAVPGEDMTSVFQTIDPGDIARQAVRGDVSGRDALKFLILGLPLRTESVSQITRARDLRPSFLLVWMGNNDVLGMATRTDPNAEMTSPAQFAVQFRRLLQELANTGAPMAVGNLPDPTGIPALRRAAGDVTTCRTAAGTTEPVAPDDLLSIDLDPALLPTPPCGKVLNATERAAVRAKVVAINAEIAAIIHEVELARGVAIAPVDMFTKFDDAARDGVDVNGDGTPDVTTRYLGGLFSLDGVHPSRTGNAFVANAFIDAINSRFGEGISPVNVVRVAARDPLAHSRFRPAGEPPFGLIDDSADDEVEDFFPSIFERVRLKTSDFTDELENLIDRFF